MAEKIQRIMISIVLAAGLVLHALGFSWGLYLNWFVLAMVALWGITEFCPFLAFLRLIGVPSEKDKMEIASVL